MAYLGWQNAIDLDGVALAASSAVDGLGPELLRISARGSPAEAWQTLAGTTEAWLQVTLPAAGIWQAVALCRSNLTPGATLRVRIWATASTVPAPAYDSGTVSAGVAVGVGQALHIMPAAVSGMLMRIDLSDPANPDRSLNLPLAYAGPLVDVAISPDANTGPEVRRADVTARAGQVMVDPLSRARGWQFRLPAVRQADLAWLAGLEAAAAAGRNILFIPSQGDERASAETVFGLLTPGRLGFVGTTGRFRVWSASISERL